MFVVVRVLMLLWTLVWAGVGCLSVVGGAAAVTEGSEPSLTLEQVMSENPDMTEAEAQQTLDAYAAGAAVGGLGLIGFGVLGSGLAWFVGMVPLLVLYLVFKPRPNTTVMVQQVVGEGSPTQTPPQRR